METPALLGPLERANLIHSLKAPSNGNNKVDLAVAQAVSRWLPAVDARVRVRAACMVYGEQSGTGAVFLRVLRFSLSFIIPPTYPSS
jgi:hypothetical protein